MKSDARGKWAWPWIPLLFAILFVYFFGSQPPLNSSDVPYSEFLSEVRAGHVAEVQIKDRTLVGTLKLDNRDSKKSTAGRLIFTTRLPGIPDTELLKELDAQHVKYSGSGESGSSWMSTLLIWVLPLLLLGSIYMTAIKGLGHSPALTFGKNRAKIYDQSDRLNVSFQDVAGVDEAEAELVEIIDFLKSPEKYQRLGGRIPKGVLLVGPPGTGKTLLAKAVAGEAGVAFFSISGSDFVEMFVGVGAARVRDLFEQAKAKAPCIVFIDELDAIGKSRSTHRALNGGNDEREQTLNQLLVEMDGFDTSKGVIIMAATNAPEVLDAALVRPGRFDRLVVIDRPDLAGREQILKLHARKVKLGPGVELATIAARTPGMVGSDLANIVNEAALLAARRGADEVQMRDLEEAIDRVMLGLEKRTRVMSEEDKERVAYHETGHALVALSVEHSDPVHRISIIPRSVSALGYTLQLPTHERFLMTQPELEDRIAVMLGGRAAEEIIYHGVISTGAADDLEKVSELVRQMVMRFGMSEQLGQLTYGHPSKNGFLPNGLTAEERNYSERTAQKIDEEARRIIDQIHHRVHSILAQKRRELRSIADALIRKETLTRPEIDELLAQHAAATLLTS
ncbi:MAG TPA: ATP-dependent zinc metalloprotease FtsH [Bryobacteraceae bacterium]|nr:ATP-dependent zinc metalloprotease FtsH [Bryobacteraceae bacterium]